MRYTEEHEWIRPEDDEEDVVTVGLTEHAVEILGNLVFVELPEEGTTVAREDQVVVIESDNATSEILAAMDGEIVEVNSALEDDPTLANEDPLGRGWFFRMRVEDMGELDNLMDEAAYKKFV